MAKDCCNDHYCKDIVKNLLRHVKKFTKEDIAALVERNEPVLDAKHIQALRDGTLYAAISVSTFFFSIPEDTRNQIPAPKGTMFKELSEADFPLSSYSGPV